jgi:hypothetical protein
MAQSVLNALLKQPQFSNQVTEFAKQIASAKSIGEAFDIYEKCHVFMDGWTFIFSSPIGSTRAFSVNRKFANGSGVFAMFKESGVAMLDPQFFAAAKRGQSVEFQIDYSISLDTQVLSYLQTFVNIMWPTMRSLRSVLRYQVWISDAAKTTRLVKFPLVIKGAHYEQHHLYCRPCCSHRCSARFFRVSVNSLVKDSFRLESLPTLALLRIDSGAVGKSSKKVSCGLRTRVILPTAHLCRSGLSN